LEALVSIVLVNYNSFELSVSCIHSIEKCSYSNKEVIIVDNGSNEDKTHEFNNLEFSVDCNWIRSEENLGFAGGNNLGIKMSKGEILFLINNDTEVTTNLISQLVARLRENPGIGLISPKIKFFNTNIIQYAGYTPLNILMQNKAVCFGKEDQVDHNDFIPTSYIHGAAMMTTRNVITTCGMMNEEYFLYYEELDWSEQVRSHGFEIWVDQQAVIYHKESMSIGANSPLKVYYNVRNRMFFSIRNKSKLQNIIFLSYSLFILPIKLAGNLFKNETEFNNSILKAYFWNLRRLMKKNHNN